MLHVDHLGFGFQHRLLFERVCFNVQAGDLHLLVGGNGTGKSTLLNILAGLLSPTKGTYRYDPSERSQTIEFLQAEANGLFYKMDAVQNLRYWASLRGQQLQRDDIYRELERWQLNHPFIRENFPVEKYSTGMKRRLALARVVLSQRKLWLLDEPFHGLDQKALSIFNQALDEHRKLGGAALVVSHDLAPFANTDHATIQLESFRSHA